jgi:hypothetical protein
LRRSAAQDGAAAERAMSSEPLKLELDGRALSFATLDDFAFGLSGRTRMAADSIGRLMQLTPSELRREATNIRDVERRFVDLLAEALKDPGAVAALLRQVDGSLITEENQWRSIIAAIAREGRGLEAYTHLAIVKYMQYLAARRDVVKSIYAQRFGGQEALGGQEPAVDGDARSTLKLEAEDESNMEPSRVRFRRLPRGETVQVCAPLNGELTILFSRHRFQLRTAERPCLTDDNGVSYPLKSGVNAIGRHPDNDVVIGGWYRDVSRKHLVIDTSDIPTLNLTDLSTHGTFLPAALLDDSDG